MNEMYLKTAGIGFACFVLCLAPAMGQSREKDRIVTPSDTEIILQREVMTASNSIAVLNLNVKMGCAARTKNAEEILHIEETEEVMQETLSEEEIVQSKILEAQYKINNIPSNDKKEWFIQYKQIQKEYAEWADPDETIYDVFNENEIELLWRIVETEVRGDCNFLEKVNVANVIFNRIENEKFPNTLTNVLTAHRQFSSYGSGAYKKVTVTETTKLACEYAYQFTDTTNGALWFDSTNGKSWADRHKTRLFTDTVGHAFYK